MPEPISFERARSSLIGLARRFREDPASLLSAFSWAITVVFTALIVHVAWTTDCFYGDDFGAFLMSKERPLGESLLAPLGYQVVPLHRAVALLLYATLPMKWGAAVLVIAAFHGLGIAYLFRTLELVRRTPLNALIVAFYATNVLAGVQLTWFSSGLTRASYVAFCLIAIFHYLRFCQSGRRRELLWVVLCYVLALGFYSKAIFIPVYCLAIDIAWRGMGAVRTRPEERPKWLVLAGLLALAPIYAVSTRRLLDETGRMVNLDPTQLFTFVRVTFVVLAHELAGIVLTLEDYRPSVALLAVWGGVLLYVVVRSRTAIRSLVIAALLVALNVSVIAVSNRTLFWGPWVIFEKRYHYELGFFLAIIAGIVARDLSSSASELRWLSRRAPAALPLLGAALLATHAAVTYPAFRSIAASSPEPRTCEYLRHLTADLRGLGAFGANRGSHLAIRDGILPRHVTGLDMFFFRQSQLLRVLGVKARFDPRAELQILDDGHVVARPK